MRKRSKKDKGCLQRIFYILVFMILLATIAAIAYIVHIEHQKSQRETYEEKGQHQKTEESKHDHVTTRVVPRDLEVTRPPERIQPQEIPVPVVPPKREGRKIAIIIDDLGPDLKPIRELLTIPASITFSILPYYAHSRDASDILHKAGKEILLHLPMEPHDYPAINPGRGALLIAMTDDELKRQTQKDIDAVPHIKGINNHMGSRFMESAAKLNIVMEEVKQKDLFFIDSRTTVHTKGEEVARKLGIHFAARNIFIDNEQDYEKTYSQLMALVLNGHKAGQVILIGHPYPSTIAALKKAIPLLKTEGIEIVPVSVLTGIPLEGRPGF